MADVLVVGAGSAGAVVAGRAATRFGRTVTLVEAGPVHDAATVPDAIAGPNFHRALEVPGRVWPGAYASGRGIGGSSAVNAMVGLVAGLDHLSVPDDLPLPLNPATHRERGLLSTLFAAAAPAVGLAVGDALLTRDATGRRWSVDEAYLEPARRSGCLDVVGGTTVDRILLERGRAVGVRLADGRELEAGRVVVSAGAVRSPAVLLRSGIDRPGIGVGLQDHPSITVPVRLRADAVDALDRALGRGAGDVVSVTSLGRATHGVPGDLQVLAADGVDARDATRAVLVASLLRVESRGRVRLASADPLVDPLVEFDPWGNATDRDALDAAHRVLDTLVANPQLAAAIDEVFEPVRGGAYHATSTCRAGRPDDPWAVVDHDGRVLGVDGLWVCDASVFPRVPQSNPHLAVVLLAERVVSSVCS